MPHQDVIRNDVRRATSREQRRRGSRGISGTNRKSLLAGIAAGSALAVFGASRKSLVGAGLAAIGGTMVFNSVRSLRARGLQLYVHQSLHINQPIDKLYAFWRDFENLPTFMQHLKSVRTTGARYSHWEARGPINTSFSWDAEVSDERENDYIVWRSLPGSTIANRGSIEFRPARGHEGSEIHVTIQYDVPGGQLGAGFARIFGEHPEQQVRDDMRRFKQLMETGEIATTTGQTSGRRSPWIRMMQAAATEREASQVDEPQKNLA